MWSLQQAQESKLGRLWEFEHYLFFALKWD
jgi:hypothetical protein